MGEGVFLVGPRPYLPVLQQLLNFQRRSNGTEVDELDVCACKNEPAMRCADALHLCLLPARTESERSLFVAPQARQGRGLLCRLNK